MYIKCYDSAGKAISEGTGLAPVVVGPLNATNNEVSAPVAITAKVDTGFTSSGNATVSFVGTTAAKWSVCATQTGTYASMLIISTPITQDGTTFYVKVCATSDEAPSNDSTVDIKIETVIAAV